ncbi:hypothetical protein HPP92_020891 [Vanilla planifolia]|uniref:Uncharacterized protein n=1 Tax=Vanilla planifolia TaxID=51239 RepID=A0A835PVN1_VANPL|nr:hypothetical protein HPP92_020891 [Vanilla planifolia]
MTRRRRSPPPSGRPLSSGRDFRTLSYPISSLSTPTALKKMAEVADKSCLISGSSGRTYTLRRDSPPLPPRCGWSEPVSASGKVT